MKTLNVGKILLLCAFAIGLTSCGDDVYYTMENSEYKRCDRTWVDNKGQELTITYDEGGKTTVDREFSWRWADNSKEALRMTFPDGKVKYFENVWVRDHYLSGKLDGKIIMMTDASYTKN